MGKFKRLKRKDWFSAISDFLSIPYEEVELKIEKGPDLVAEDWNTTPHKTDEEIKKFYQTNENYIFDLVGWHLWGPKKEMDKDIFKMVKKPAGPVLDFGCGVGFIGINLALRGHDVTLMDYDNPPLKFAKFMIERIGCHCEVVTLEELETVFPKLEHKFNYIICMDVLEHASKPIEVSKNLLRLVSKNGQIIMTAPFGETEDHPMHMDVTDDARESVKMIQSHLLLPGKRNEV